MFSSRGRVQEEVSPNDFTPQQLIRVAGLKDKRSFRSKFFSWDVMGM